MINDNNYEDILVSQLDTGVLTITLNRPKSYNALRNNALKEIADVLTSAEKDNNIKVIIITGGEKVFAAGADIKEMNKLNVVGLLNDNRPVFWNEIANCSKPIIAVVNGFALGAGCELMMHCDIVIAGDNAQIGQPEINLGIIPGAGGTQRLLRTVGKSMAMQMVLSGEFINAEQAKNFGLVSEITLPELSYHRALKLAKVIANKSPIAVRLAKESLLYAYESTLAAGLAAERKAFILLAATDDRTEGITAFIEKRQPIFKGQ